MKKYEILDGLPAYGDMYIPIAPNNEPYYSEGFVVRFFNSGGSFWTANFKPGWTKFNKVVELENTPLLIIIAGGSCYIMDPDIQKPIEIFGIGVTDALNAPDARLILIDQTDLTIVETNGKHWDSERISWDGFKDVSISMNLVIGLSFDPMNHADEWVAFEYDIDSKNLKGGSYHRYGF